MTAAPGPLEAEAWLAEAVDTLRRLPAAYVAPRLTRWPALVRASREAYGYEAARPRRGPAAPEAITRLDVVLMALRRVPVEEQRLLWSRANGFSWRRIAALAGAAPNTCRTRYLGALIGFAALLAAPEAG
jgi:hypothetical protein